MADSDGKKPEPAEHVHDAVDDLAAAMGEVHPPENEPGPVRALRRVDDTLGIVEQAAVGLFLATLIVVSVYKFAAGFIFDHNPPWPKTFIQWSVFLVATSAATLSAKTGQMISMDFVTRKLTGKQRAALRVVVALFTICVCVLFAHGAMIARDTIRATPDVLDERLVATALPIALGTIAVHVLLHGIIDAIYLIRGQTPPEPEEPSAH